VFAIIIPYFTVLHKHAQGVSWSTCAAILRVFNGCPVEVQSVAHWAVAATSNGQIMLALEKEVKQRALSTPRFAQE